MRWLAFLLALLVAAPSYALTPPQRASSGVQTGADLDFVNGRYRVGNTRAGVFTGLTGASFTRASIGYADTSAGVLVQFASGQPRITDKGLLIEESRTNVVLQSQALATTWATGVGGVASVPVITNNFATAPDGTLTASRIQAALNGGTTTTDNSYTSQPLTIGSTGFYSAWFKTNDGTTKTIWFRAGGNTNSLTINGTWTRYSFASPIMSGAQFAIGLRGGQTPTNSDSADILVWGVQMEAGAFATSYIPTTGASATRAADNASLAYLATVDGYVFVEHVQPAALVAANPRLIGNLTGSSGTVLLSNGTGGGFYNGTVNLTATATLTAGLTYRQASTWDASGRGYDIAGATAASDANLASVFTGGGFFIGSGNTLYVNTYIRRVSVGTRRLSASELQAMTQ